MAGNARALEQERAKAQIDHNRAVDKLTRLCNVAAPNQRAVQNALTTAEHVFDKLQDSHVAYVFKLNSTIDNPIHKGWMDHRNNEHEQAVEIAQVVLGHLEVIDDQNVPVQEAGPTLEDKIDNFNVANLRIVAQLAQLTIESNKDNITLDQYGALSASAKDVRQEMLGEFRANCRDIQASTEEVAERATAKTAHDAFFVTNLPLIETVLVKLDAKKPAAGGPVGGGAGAAPGAAGHAIHPDPGLNRLARAKAPNLPCPNFDGRVASYSRFKLKFQELVAKHYEEQAQIELLEKALPTAVLSSLSLDTKINRGYLGTVG